MDSVPTISSKSCGYSAPTAWMVKPKKRMITSMAHLSSTPESRAETGLGAWEWASGSQVCMGNRPALVPKPITINAKARRMSVGSNWSA